jgi:ketosteroid isomerase-like protein
MTDTASSDEIWARLRRLEAIEVARHVVAAYARAVDGRDLDGLGALFAPHATLTASGRPYTGIDAIVEFYRASFAGDPSTRRHFVTNLDVVEADDDRVVIRSYFLYTAGTRGESILGWGRYDDTVGRVDGRAVLVAKQIDVDHRAPVSVGWAASEPAGPR